MERAGVYPEWILLEHDQGGDGQVWTYCECHGGDERVGLYGQYESERAGKLYHTRTMTAGGVTS